MAHNALKRNIFQRLFGIPATRPPQDPGCWSIGGGQLTIDLAKAPELSSKGGAIRLEGSGLPHRVLVFQDDEGTYRAYRNACGHVGRRVDPVPGDGTIQCCSFNHATYDYDCNKLEGPGDKPVTQHTVQEQDGKLIVELG